MHENDASIRPWSMNPSETYITSGIWTFARVWIPHSAMTKPPLCPISWAVTCSTKLVHCIQRPATHKGFGQQKWHKIARRFWVAPSNAVIHDNSIQLAPTFLLNVVCSWRPEGPSGFQKHGCTMEQKGADSRLCLGQPKTKIED